MGGQRREKRRKRVVRFAGICAAARLLGVSRMHLYHVLAGLRISHRLSADWTRINRTHRFDRRHDAWIPKGGVA